MNFETQYKLKEVDMQPYQTIGTDDNLIQSWERLLARDEERFTSWQRFSILLLIGLAGLIAPLTSDIYVISLFVL
jgi:hypothetical protein